MRGHRVYAGVRGVTRAESLHAASDGLPIEIVPIDVDEEASVQAVFETNFFGPLRTIRAVLPGMRERRSGTIVNVSSVVGRVAPGGGGVYPASKFALEAASEALAWGEVFSFGIRVAIIEPSFTVTPILEKTIDSLSGDGASPYSDTERRVRLMFEQAQSSGGSPPRWPRSLSTP